MSIKAEDNIMLESQKVIHDVAANTDQYFWHTSTGTDTGAHITEKTKEDFLDDPANGGGNLLARSNGIAVRDGLTELARFGADGMQVGKDEKQHIVITPSAFNVYDEDGGNPFSVTTDSSLKTVGYTNLSSVLGTSYQYLSTAVININLLGQVTDNRYYIGVSSTGDPTDYSEYFENPTATWSTVKAINGVECKIRKLSESSIQVSFINTVNAKRYLGVKYTQTYRESTMKFNDALFTNQYHKLTFIDSTGTSDPQISYAQTYGKIAMLNLCVWRSNVPNGSFIYEGTLLNDVPLETAGLIGYYGGKVIYGSISNQGDVWVSNTTGQTISPTQASPVMLRGTYIIR